MIKYFYYYLLVVDHSLQLLCENEIVFTLVCSNKVDEKPVS